MGWCVLILEDEFLKGEDFAGAFAKAGAEVLGPITLLADALALPQDSFDAAVLDIRLVDGDCYPVAEQLMSRLDRRHDQADADPDLDRNQGARRPLRGVADGAAWLGFEGPDDTVFWNASTGELATDLGRAFALGEDNISNPGTFAFDCNLNLFADPLNWLRAKRDGVVVLDWAR